MQNPHVAALNRAAERCTMDWLDDADRAEFYVGKAYEYAALADGLEHSLAIARRRADRADADLRLARSVSL